MKGLFVTGTDTGVGKTVISAAIALKMKENGINVGVMNAYHKSILFAHTLVPHEAHRQQQTTWCRRHPRYSCGQAHKTL